MQMEPQGYIGRALDAVDADFSVTLRRVRIARGEKCSVIKHRQVKRGSARQLTNVHIPAKHSRGTRAKLTVGGLVHSHHSTKWPQRNNCRSQRSADLALELPVKKIRLRKTLLQKTKSGDHARPSPALVSHFEYVDLQHVAGRCAFYIKRPGKRMDE